MRISSKGLNLIKYYEGFSETVYVCPGGHKTYGFGHKDNTVRDDFKITVEQAELLLRSDLKSIEIMLNGYDLTQNEFDALCSFVYNVGEGAFISSTLRRKIINCDYNGAAKEFDRWVFAGGKVCKGLIKRRNAEKNLFLTPVNK